jgi:hypothetical protein
VYVSDTGIPNLFLAQRSLSLDSRGC